MRQNKKYKKSQFNQTKYLLNDEYERLVEILEKYKSTNERDTAMIELALRTGARASEILNLKKADVYQIENQGEDNGCYVYIKGIKGSKDREIPIGINLFQRIENLKSQSETDRIFQISYSRLKQIWEAYRPTKKKFHSLRHTFAIRAYERKKDIRGVQKMLGHTNILNTMVYADYIYSRREMKELAKGA